MSHHYESLDMNRTSAIYFAIVALDILGDLDSVDKKEVSDFIYSLQLESKGEDGAHAGFMGTTSYGQPYGQCLCGVAAATGAPIATAAPATAVVAATPAPEPVCADCSSSSLGCCFMKGHLAMAYTSLAILVTIGDDLSRVDRQGLVAQIKSLQQPDGSFASAPGEKECDMRFVFCACVVSHLIGDWSGMNKPAALAFIQSCMTYEGGFGLFPSGEAQGGSCYCGVASLALMGYLDDPELLKDTIDIERIRHFCLNRQVGGYQGRTNKVADSCYSFWHGATLMLLESFQDSDLDSTRNFLLGQCQCVDLGGFSKYPQPWMPDILHSFYSLCWLAMANTAQLRPIDPVVGICTDRSATIGK